ncbi:MAG: LPS export ABC transporter periplasmic protein LptC [Pseudomonadota bacterium]
MSTVASDSYSRLISWLKVVLPLSALAILSTLFLLSRSGEQEAQVPFADQEIKEWLRDQQVTGPFFSGTTTDGDQLSFSAEKLTTPEGQTGASEAVDVRVEMAFTSGSTLDLTADQARFDMAENHVELEGRVVIVSSAGYRLTSQRLTSRMSAVDLVSPGPVEGEGPMGTLIAGSMTLSAPKSGESAQLVFKDRVKLVYDPANAE